MKYFYIITFDNQIFEVTYSEEKINSAIQAWKDGSILFFKELGGGIHGNSISKVLNEDNYESYTYSVKPNLFIKDGTWYDGKERKMVRREKWKQLQIEDKLQIEKPKVEIVPPERSKEVLKKYAPDFVNEIRGLGDKFKSN
jgi:hypothetical protein